MNTSPVHCCFCLAALTLTLATPVPHARGDEASEITKLDRGIQEVEKSLASPVAGKREYVAANNALQTLLDQTTKLMRTDGDEDPESPLHKLHDRILSAQKSVQARLPNGGKHLFVRTGLPVPEYDEEELLGQLAAELQAAQTALAALLSASPADAAGARKRLHAMVLAQEKLAWEAGWPFFPDEVSAFKKADNQLTAEVYHARRARGVKRINQQLATEALRVGRQPPRDFVIHAPSDDKHVAEISKTLADSRGPAAEEWAKGSRRFDGREREALLGPR